MAKIRVQKSLKEKAELAKKFKKKNSKKPSKTRIKVTRKK